MDNESEGSVVTLVDEDMESVVTVKTYVASADYIRVEDEIGQFEEVDGDVVEKITEDVEEDEERAVERISEKQVLWHGDLQGITSCNKVI